MGNSEILPKDITVRLAMSENYEQTDPDSENGSSENKEKSEESFPTLYQRHLDKREKLFQEIKDDNVEKVEKIMAAMPCMLNHLYFCCAVKSCIKLYCIRRSTNAFTKSCESFLNQCSEILVQGQNAPLPCYVLRFFNN